MKIGPRVIATFSAWVLGVLLITGGFGGALGADRTRPAQGDRTFRALNLDSEHAVTAWLRGALLGAHGLSSALTEELLQVLVSLATNPEFVAATERQNARRVPLSVVRERDREWISSERVSALQLEIRTNACAMSLISALAHNPEVAEAFVMDNQGALVCATVLTSDYWQGDEAKWIRAYNEGYGGIDVGSAQFDDSAGVVLRHVSLPLLNGGRAIGAITVGLRTVR